MTQLISRGLRNAPVKNTRNRWTVIAARNSSAAQWCTCRISRPPRMSNEMSSVDAYASVIRMPLSGTYDPWYATSTMDGLKNSERYTPVSSSTMKL